VNFAFSLIGKNRATLSQVMSAWATWRHDGEIGNANAVALTSVDAALDVTLAALGKGDTIGDVWVYADGDDRGRMIASLRKSESGTGIDPKTASEFAQKSDKAKKLASFSDDATRLHLLGCNASLSKESLGAWREVFAGAKGVVVAPTGFWQLAFRTESRNIAIAANKKQGCKSKSVTVAPKDRADYEALLRAIESAVDALVAQGCLAEDRAATVKQDRRAEATRHFDAILVEWFDLLLRANAPGRDAILDGMWALWDSAGGIVFPFIGTKRTSISATKGKRPADLAKDKAQAAVIPSAADWQTKFLSRPKQAANVKPADSGTPLADQEKEANRIAKELHPHFQAVFSFRSKGRDVLHGAKLQKAVPVKVLKDTALEAMALKEFQRQWDREVEVIVRLDPDGAGERAGKAVTSSKDLTVKERQEIRTTRRPTKLEVPVTAAALYSPADHTIYVRDGNVSDAIIGHELAHAYASNDWTAAIDAISIYGGAGEKGKDLDEGMASIMSQMAVDEWVRSKSSGVPQKAPDTSIGYMPRVLRYAEHFISLAERGPTTPAKTVFEAYFGGTIVLVKDGRELELTVGKTDPQTFKLSDVKLAK
jgi:hypothetical protein